MDDKRNHDLWTGMNRTKKSNVQQQFYQYEKKRNNDLWTELKKYNEKHLMD